MFEVDATDHFLNERFRQEEEWEKNLPVCSKCGEPIFDDYYYEIDGEVFCEDCMKEEFRKSNG